MLDGQSYGTTSGRCLDGAVSGRLEHVANQLHVLLVVFDDQDLLLCHGSAAYAPSVNVMSPLIARSRTLTTPRSSASGRENGARRSSIWPDSTLARSSTSSMSDRRSRAEARMSSRYSACFSLISPNSCLRSTCEKP